MSAYTLQRQRAPWVAALLLGSAGLLQAQGSGAEAAPGSLAPVRVTGSRNSAIDPAVVEAAKSKVLSRQLASSCAFMSSYKAGEDEVTLAYMRDFGMSDSPSNEAERFRDSSPQGNAAVATPTAADAAASSNSASDPLAPSVSCGKSDRAFAAGRNWIARKDKSLGQAFDAFEAEDYGLARARFLEAYDKLGYEEAAMMLGRIHLLGLGTPKDTGQAVAWFRKVTDARYDPVQDRMRFDARQPERMSVRVDAALMLAKVYLLGQGTRPDPAQVRAWYAKALDFGFAPAGQLLGQTYLLGYGGDRNPRRAQDYLRAAADEGHVPAQYQLARLYQNGAPGVSQDLTLAGAYYGAAAKAGHVESIYAAARMLDLGEGAKADPNRALVLYKEAAVKGHALAQNALATYFYSGQGVSQDLETARKLFQAAATRGQADAMFNLAVMQTRGEGGPKDLAMAFVWFTLARASGHDQALPALRAVEPLLQPADRARADAILKPKAKS